jgi:hypothetical protein
MAGTTTAATTTPILAYRFRMNELSGRNPSAATDPSSERQ